MGSCLFNDADDIQKQSLANRSVKVGIFHPRIEGQKAQTVFRFWCFVRSRVNTIQVYI